MKRYNIKPNDNQITLLKIIYKFRFVSSDLVASYKGVTKRVINESLMRLLDQDFIARRYDASYKLHGKAAQYYLAPKSLKLLRDEYGLNKDVLHARYKDESVSDLFIEHNLNIFKTCLAVKEKHDNMFYIFTKSELADYYSFPLPLPDIYLSRVETSDIVTNEYFIDIFEGTQFFIIKKRINQYMEHFESGEWDQAIYPTIILICANSRIEDKVATYAQTTLGNKYLDERDMIFITSNFKEISNKITV